MCVNIFTSLSSKYKLLSTIKVYQRHFITFIQWKYVTPLHPRTHFISFRTIYFYLFHIMRILFFWNTKLINEKLDFEILGNVRSSSSSMKDLICLWRWWYLFASKLRHAIAHWSSSMCKTKRFLRTPAETSFLTFSLSMHIVSSL